jgi:hypothetical protein
MSKTGEERAAERLNRRGALFMLALLAPLSGIGAGFIGAAFRFTLAEADFLRGVVIAWTYGWSIAGFVFVVVRVPDCWRTCWYRNTVIIYRCIGRRRFMREPISICRALHLPTWSGRWRGCCGR